MKTKSPHLDELTQKIHKDDKAFAALYRAYFSQLCNYLMPKVNYDSALAEDLTANAFEKAFLNRGRFKWQGISFNSWIYKIANNLLIDYYRKSSTKLATTLDPAYISDKQTSIENSLISEDLSAYIQSSLKNLDEREREVVNLKFYEGYTNKAIAIELNISETNVGTILYRSMKKIRKALDQRNV
jgi:RNA polymerase sigma factor (sigma-70 family)